MTSPAALISDVQLNVLSHSSFLDFSMTSKFVTGAAPTEKNPISADRSMSEGMLETKYIAAHVIAIATEHRRLWSSASAWRLLAGPRKLRQLSLPSLRGTWRLPLPLLGRQAQACKLELWWKDRLR